MATDIKIPQLGESISEVQIAQWQKSKGDLVEKDETLVTIDSEKATVDVPAPAAGKLVEILVADGKDAKVGDVIGRIESDGSTKDSEDKKSSAKTAKTTDDDSKKKPSARSSRSKPTKTKSKEDDDSSKKSDDAAKAPRVMPAAKRLLEANDLKAEDIEATGPGGRLLKEDVLAHLESETDADEPVDEKVDDSVGDKDASGSTGNREDEIVSMSPLRRTVARRLVEAQQTMAILTTFNEIDMSEVIKLRKAHKETFQEKHGVKLGFMSFFVKAVIGALQEVPRLNAEISDNKIVQHHYSDIGVAIGAGKGLVVPPLRNAERMGFAEIEKAIADLSTRAQNNQLKPADLEGGTFTISNGGVYGSLLSTPIINPPQSGILGLHAIQERPVAVEGQVVIRPMMYVALSYDHRLVDGREAVTFLRLVKDYVENPVRLLIDL